MAILVSNKDMMISMRISVIILMCIILTPICAMSARLKDIADIEGVRGNQLYGYGLVVGLNGTGDGKKVEFTLKSLSNMLEKMGVRTDPNDLKVKNVAAVLVTAELPPFVRPGTRIDVTLSSLGDAKSLEGGTLLMTPLRGADGNVYAVAQGAVAVGGFAVEGGGDSARRNHPTVGIVSNGAIVERAIPFDLFQSQKIRIVLRHPDFTTMKRLVREINLAMGGEFARALDSASVEVPLVGKFKDDPISLVSQLEALDIREDSEAKVVVNERTGTVIIGENVRLGTVALAHGNLNITIRSETTVSQPPPLSQQGQTQQVSNSDVSVVEETGSFAVVSKTTTLGELVHALNSLGASSRDIITIFVALKKAGALKAKLEFM